jgi:hypothetical protein
MNLTDFPELLNRYIANNKREIGDIKLDVSQIIDISIFPDEEHKLPESNDGLYLFFNKNNDELLYVGISTNLSQRIYKHIGPGFSWARNHNKAHFPNVSLTDGRGWVQETTKALFENAEINILTIGVSPSEASSLLESYIILYGFRKGEKPELNVEF